MQRIAILFLVAGLAALCTTGGFFAYIGAMGLHWALLFIYTALVGAVGLGMLWFAHLLWHTKHPRASGEYWPLGSLVGGLYFLWKGPATETEWHGTLVHEAFHRFEHVVDGVVELEREFRQKRMDSGIAWFYHYAGGRNWSGSFEVLTQGYQAMTFATDSPETEERDPAVQPDPEHEAFVLGVLATL